MDEEDELRDRFAIIAFQTLMYGALPLIAKHCENPTERMRANCYDTAKTCYTFADAMMSARDLARDFSEEQKEEKGEKESHASDAY